jgi:flagellar FliL protein
MEDNFEPNLGPEKKSSLNPKVFLVGVPLFIIQLVAVYFITANILLSKFEKGETKNLTKTEAVEHDSTDSEGEEGAQAADEEGVSQDGEESSSEGGSAHGGGGEGGSTASSPSSYIYTVNDVIINPAGTNGQRLMLTSIGFDMKTESQYKKMESKEIVLKDAIISVLSKKTVSQLSNTMKRDSLKVEIINDVKDRIPGLKIKDLYFTKYIIQ